MRNRSLASFLLVCCLETSFGGHLKALPKTVFYYSQKGDGTLKFSDEPPMEAPRRASYKNYRARKNVSTNGVRTATAKDFASNAYRGDARFEAVVYVPQSEIEVSYSPTYDRKFNSTLKATYQDMIRNAALEHRVEPALIAAIIKTESGNNPSAVSHKGARGLMQLMPGTAATLGVENIHDPEQNIRGGTKYIKKLLTRYHGNIDLALAAYNAGDGAVEKYRGVPPYRETIDYIARVRKYYRQFDNF